MSRKAAGSSAEDSTNGTKEGGGGSGGGGPTHTVEERGRGQGRKGGRARERRLPDINFLIFDRSCRLKWGSFLGT